MTGPREDESQASEGKPEGEEGGPGPPRPFFPFVFSFVIFLMSYLPFLCTAGMG